MPNHTDLIREWTHRALDCNRFGFLKQGERPDAIRMSIGFAESLAVIVQRPGELGTESSGPAKRDRVLEVCMGCVAMADSPCKASQHAIRAWAGGECQHFSVRMQLRVLLSRQFNVSRKHGDQPESDTRHST
ncbi:MAG: hypothetical protein ACKVQT_32820 [Burkholderiales bacterium]